MIRRWDGRPVSAYRPIVRPPPPPPLSPRFPPFPAEIYIIENDILLLYTLRAKPAAALAPPLTIRII